LGDSIPYFKANINDIAEIRDFMKDKNIDKFNFAVAISVFDPGPVVLVLFCFITNQHN